MVLAAAPAPEAPQVGQTVERGDSKAPVPGRPASLIHTASLKSETREVPAKAVAELPPAAAAKSSDGPVTAAKPARTGSQDRPGLAAAKSSAGTSPGSTKSRRASDAAAKPVKPAELAQAR